MFSSLRARLWLSYVLIIAVALGVVTIAFGLYLLRNPLLYRQTQERLRTVETLVVARQNGLLGQLGPNALQRVTETFDVRVLQFDENGEKIQDTNPSQGELRIPRQPVFARAIPTVRDANGRVWLYTLRQMDDGSTLMVTTPRPRVPLLQILRDDLMPIFLQGGGVAFLLSLVLAFGVARWIADPLQRLVGVSRQFPLTSTQPVPERGPHEVRELTRAFNAMIVRVQSSQKSQRDFVANVSHELKTPLTSVQGFAQAILDGTADTPESQRQAAEVIYNESGRMYRMVLDLLDLARLDAGTADLNMAPIDVHLLLNSLVEKFAPQAGRASVSLHIEAESDLPLLAGDGDRLAQVFTNLLDNALKHTPEGGNVTLHAESDGSGMQIQVIDTGEGIPEEALEHIFERFYQADPSRRGGETHGSGLGLAIAQEIVAAHGGRITVRSQEERGTIFTVRLPLLQPEATTFVSQKK